MVNVRKTIHAGTDRRALATCFLLTFLWTLLAAALIIGPADASEKTRLNYRLKWLFNASVAGDIYALDQGFFAAEGLSVDVKEGSPEKNAIRELELGQADFGVASADQVIRALEKGADVVVVAQLFQVNPMQWIYRSQKLSIDSLQDLKGRRIGVTYGGNDETIMNTLLAAAGIEPGEVTLSGVRFDFTPFLKGEVEVWPVYRNSQGVILKRQLAEEGESVAFFNPADHGVRFVANSVITSGATARNRLEIVKRFLTALLKGWEASMDPANETVTLDLLTRYDRGNTRPIILSQLAATRDLIKPAPNQAIGTIDEEAWKQTEAIMLKQGQIAKPVDVQARLIQTF